MPERLSASVASRHLGCHASANLELAIPGWTPPEEDPNADNAANRGTAMHALFAEVVGLKAGELKKFSEAIEYVADLRMQRRFKVLIEQEVQVEWLTQKPWTTADLVLYTQDELHIVDLKWGRIPVSPAGNQQLMYYALAYGGLAPKANGAMLHIVQPTAGFMGEWFATTQMLQQYMQELVDADLAIQLGDTTFGPGDHCMFCEANPHGRGAKGRPFCPAMMDMYYPIKPLDRAAIFEEDEKE